MGNHNILRSIAVVGAVTAGSSAVSPTSAEAAIKPPTYSFKSFASAIESLPLKWHHAGIVGKWAIERARGGQEVLVEVNVAGQPVPGSQTHELVQKSPVEVAVSIYPAGTNMSEQTPGPNSTNGHVDTNVYYWIGNETLGNKHHRWAKINTDHG